MKREHYEKWILQDQSESLTGRKKEKLNEAIEQDPHLQAYQKSILEMSSATLSKSDGPVGPGAADILRYARRHQAQTREKESFFTLWQPAMGYAAIAVALAMVSLYYFQQEPTPVHQTANTPSILDPELLAWDAPYEDELAQLKSEFMDFQSSFLTDTTSSETTSELATTLILYGESS